MVKINHAEAGELLREEVGDLAGASLAARELIRMGAQQAMITLGPKGAVLASDGAVYSLEAPRVRAVNSVGSGDAVLAGLAAGFRRGLHISETATLALAAGAANALHGMGRCTAEEIYGLQPQVSFSVEA
jgi:fructose-1-phosphate kinase PfkB-like protein